MSRCILLLATANECFWSVMYSMLSHMFMLHYYMETNKAYTTINGAYHGITRIEQVEDGGLSISYVYLMYKTIDSIFSPSVFRHMPGQIFAIPERPCNSATAQAIPAWTGKFRNG